MRTNVGRRWLSGLVATAISLIVTLILAEGLFRIARDVVKAGPQSDRAEIADDNELGWVLNAGRRTLDLVNGCGEKVTRRPPPGRYLAKLPRHPAGERLLFLGDSFTHAHEVSTGAAYYDVFERETGDRYAVYAAGVGGYGTVQEFLLLGKVASDVAPRILVWQLCGNDVFENVYAGADPHTVQKPRPYVDPATGRVFHADPSAWLLRHSELARFCYGRLAGFDRVHPFGLMKLVDGALGSHATSRSRVEQEGLAVLSRLVGEAHRELPGVRIIGFSADRERDDAYAAIFRAHGLEYWPGIAAAVAAESVRTDCAPLDTHWNHAGNAAAGRLLARRLSLAAAPVAGHSAPRE